MFLGIYGSLKYKCGRSHIPIRLRELILQIDVMEIYIWLMSLENKHWVFYFSKFYKYFYHVRTGLSDR